MKQADVYKNDILPNLKKGKTLAFSHGLAIHFGLIKPHKDIDIIMIAPKARATWSAASTPRARACRRSSRCARTSPRRQEAGARLGQGIGSTRAGVLQTTFKEEAETDLFGEQAVLCGGASALVQAVLRRSSRPAYQPEMAYFECLHELSSSATSCTRAASPACGLDFRDCQVRRHHPRPAHREQENQGRDEEDPEGDSSPASSPASGSRNTRAPEEVQRASQRRREAPDREDRRLPPRHDALDVQEEPQGRAGSYN